MTDTSGLLERFIFNPQKLAVKRSINSQPLSDQNKKLIICGG